MKIAAYYERLGIRNQAGDSMVSYADYWGDLSELIGEEGKDQDNHVETLLTFKELSSQIFASAKNFKSAGITRAQMRLQLRQIKGSLDSMEISEGDAYGEYETELKQTVYDYVDLAENSLSAVFNAENLR